MITCLLRFGFARELIKRRLILNRIFRRKYISIRSSGNHFGSNNNGVFGKKIEYQLTLPGVIDATQESNSDISYKQ